MIKFAERSLNISDIVDCSRDIDRAAEYMGRRDIIVDNCSIADDIGERDIIWLRNKYNVSQRLINRVQEDLDAVVVCNRVTREYIMSRTDNDQLGWLITEKPRDVYFAVIDRFKDNGIEYGWSNNNSVIESRDIGKEVSIGANCYIGSDVKIEEGVIIHNNVVIECPTIIGKCCNIYSGAVIGSPGYGYYNGIEGKKQIPHFMGVRIGHHVDIGAGTCIDRGCLGDTVIGNYVKIDNLVHIAHNVKIGDHSMVVAQAMLGGSSEYGEKTYIAPGARIFNNINVGRNATIGVGAVVKDNVDDGKTVVGIPAHEIRRN